MMRPYILPEQPYSLGCSLKLFLVQFFLTMIPLYHATLAWWDTFLQAAAIFLRDQQSPRVSSFGFPRRPAARFQPLCYFLSPARGFTMARSLGTS
jgi:hypothetical protein